MSLKFIKETTIPENDLIRVGSTYRFVGDHKLTFQSLLTVTFLWFVFVGLWLQVHLSSNVYEDAVIQTGIAFGLQPTLEEAGTVLGAATLFAIPLIGVVYWMFKIKRLKADLKNQYRYNADPLALGIFLLHPFIARMFHVADEKLLLVTPELSAFNYVFMGMDDEGVFIVENQIHIRDNLLYLETKHSTLRSAYNPVTSR